MRRLLKGIILNAFILILIFAVAFIGYIYMPKDSKVWKEEISNTSPEEYFVMSEERMDVLRDFDSFVLESASEDTVSIFKLLFSKQFKLNWNIQKDILREVSNEDISSDSLKIWYVYNMGVIAKSGESVICFDLSTPIPSIPLLQLSSVCNYLVISHGDGDHFSPFVVKNVLKNNGKVIFQNGEDILQETIEALVSDEEQEGIFNLNNETETVIDGISFYSLQTAHRGDEEKVNAWTSVKVNGFNIVHTGDGTLGDHTKWSSFGDIDVLLANSIIQSIDLKDANARYIVPLHLHELGHNRSFLEENCFTSYLNTLDTYEGDISSKIYLLLWGESIDIRK